MAVNRVSFGKITKVNAPVHTAQQIISNADKLNKNIDWKTKRFLKDVAHKPAYAYSFTKAKNESYIFTGKDAQKYRDSYDIAYDTMLYIYDNYLQEDLADTDTKIAWNEHERRIKKLVASDKRIKTIDVAYNPENKQVSKVNFSA